MIGLCGGILVWYCIGIFEWLFFKWWMNWVVCDWFDFRLWENFVFLIFLFVMKDFICMIEEMMESGEKYFVISVFILVFLIKIKLKKSFGLY